MSEHPADSSENRLRATVAGALAFVSFGLLAGLVLWIADFRSGAEATEVGQFTPEQIELRDANSKEVQAAQSALFDQKKVDNAKKGISAKPAKATSTVVPGSETDLKNLAAIAEKVAAEKAAAEAANAEGEVEAPAKGDPATSPADKSKDGREGKGKAKGKGKGKTGKVTGKGQGAPQNK